MNPKKNRVLISNATIVAPGFVDTHRHVWQTQLRGVAANWSLFDYSCLMRNAYGASDDPEDAYIGNHAGALEALAPCGQRRLGFIDP